jgi:hypothetical protein
VGGGVTNLITSTLSGNVAYSGNGGGYWSLHQTPEYEDACDLDAGDVFIQVTVAKNEAGGPGPGAAFPGRRGCMSHHSVVVDGCNFVGSTAVAYDVGQNAEPVSGSCGLGGLTLTDIQMDLGPLADNRGTTWTHLPGSGSLLIDQADNAFCPPLDQRWSFRPTHFLGVPWRPTVAGSGLRRRWVPPAVSVSSLRWCCRFLLGGSDDECGPRASPKPLARSRARATHEQEGWSAEALHPFRIWEESGAFRFLASVSLENF